MNDMEHDILMLLTRSPGTRFSHKEVGRVIDRRQYRDDCHWARPLLERLVRERAIEKEDCLYFFQEREETTFIERNGGPKSSGNSPATVEMADETARTPIKPLGTS